MITPTRYGRRSPTDVSPLSITAARNAYVRGDFGAVLDLLASVRIGDHAPVEAWLLRARALLKLQRPEDVAAELAPVLPTIVDVDERTTAAMLHGAALACLFPTHGIAVLAAIADTAQVDRAHAAVRAEISYFRAVAHWSADELGAAEELPRDTVRGSHHSTRGSRTLPAARFRRWVRRRRSCVAATRRIPCDSSGLG